MDTQQATFWGVSFLCRVMMRPFRYVEEFTTVDEDAAVAWARAKVTPFVEHVAIEACGPVAHDFAIRYLTPQGDSGWRCWSQGTFTGATSLESLFGARAVA